ncbi:MAG: phosphodiester glycosidase family protein, partial [Cyanobium sp.]
GNGNVVPLLTLNSGYVQRGLSRYTADWGPAYRSISDGENGLLVRQERVVARIDAPTLSAGIALAPGDTLLVARAGSEFPWGQGERLTIESLVSDALGEAPFVLGGGPLLLHAGRTVLDGQSEGFGAAFLSQGAPRTVIGSDGRELWLITLEGSDDEGPTLAETALLLSQLGLREALNLDGGSSTGLVVGGQQMVRGRGVTASVHNGLGLVPAGAGAGAGAPAAPGGVSQLR